MHIFDVPVRRNLQEVELFIDLSSPVVIENNKIIYGVIDAVKQSPYPMRRINNRCA
jgi:hypothetical protein